MELMSSLFPECPLFRLPSSSLLVVMILRHCQGGSKSFFVVDRRIYCSDGNIWSVEVDCIKDANTHSDDGNAIDAAGFSVSEVNKNMQND